MGFEPVTSANTSVMLYQLSYEATHWERGQLIEFLSSREDWNDVEYIWNNSSGFIRVLENLESPGICLWHFPGLESPGKGLLVLESSGNLLNSSKKYKMYDRQ